MTLGPNVIKLFTVVIYKFLQHARVFLGGKLIQPSVVFVGMAWSRGAPERWFTRVGAYLTPKH
jgi:hypothetical protein